MSDSVSLEEYRKAEVEVLREEVASEFRVHLLVYLAGNTIAVLLNLLVVDEVLWFFYPLIGWGLGLLFHYVAGVRHVEERIVKRQSRIEERALQGRAR